MFHDFERILEGDLEARNVNPKIRESRVLLQRLVHEAYARAAIEETDGIPRYGPMVREMEDVADKVALICSGNKSADVGIYRILSHHADT